MKKLIFAFICLLLAVPCQARVITVDDDGPADFNNIQAAIDDANDGDVVEVQPGIYTGDGNRDIDFKGKAVTVRSENGPEDCIIDCNGTEAEPHRGFYFHSGEDANSILDGFTITNGYATKGGGIYCSQSSPTITNCAFNGNSAHDYVQEWDHGDGGGIANYYSSARIINCTFSENSAYRGGGMCNANIIDSHRLTVTNCTFSGNSARGGGGMFNYPGYPTVNDCTFSGNLAYVGGGMLNSSGGSPTITNCVFRGNSAENNGGGMCENGNSVIINCTFSENSANGNGGGISNVSFSPTITNCIFNGNEAKGNGGGMCNESFGEMRFTNCTFSGNLAQGYGGAISNYKYSEATVTNCILYDDRALYGNEIALIFTSTVDVNYSDVEGGQAGVYVEIGSTLNWDVGNIDADPCFVEPGYWDANGTPVDANDDFWVDGDYHLKSEGWRWDSQRKIWTWDDVTSRCIDAGNPGSPLGEEPLSVPRDPNNDWGENLRINMGAYGGTAEASMAPFNWALLADLTNDGTVNFEDYTAQAIDWLESVSEQPGDLDRNGTVDIADIALLTEDWLKQTSWYTP